MVSVLVLGLGVLEWGKRSVSSCLVLSCLEWGKRSVSSCLVLSCLVLSLGMGERRTTNQRQHSGLKDTLRRFFYRPVRA
jgi:hypothetical protein